MFRCCRQFGQGFQCLGHGCGIGIIRIIYQVNSAGQRLYLHLSGNRGESGQPGLHIRDADAGCRRCARAASALSTMNRAGD